MSKTPSEWAKFYKSEIDHYNSNHEYISFSRPSANNYDLGCMCPPEDSDNPSVVMHPYDPANLYTPESAKHNISIFYDKLKQDEHNKFLNNQIKLNESNGLSFTIVRGYFNDNIDYFTTQIQTNNILNSGTVNTFTDLNTATNNYTKQINTFFSVEWTGYFKSVDSGQYQFEMISDDSSLLWFGEIALVGYNKTNLNVDNRGLHGTRKVKSVNLTVLANQYYPIRIHYGQNGGGKNFKFNIYKQDSTGKMRIVTDPSIYLKSLKDSTGSPWEPLQIYYALGQTAHSSTNHVVQITEYNVSNNYSNNKALRLAKSLPKVIYSSYWKTDNVDSSSDINGYTLHFTIAGDVLLLQNGSQINNLSNISTIPKYSTCSSGTAITQINLNICSVNYTDLHAINNGNNTTSFIFPSPPDYKCRNKTTKKYNATLSYLVGPDQVNKPITGSPGQTITISAIPEFNNCNFKLTLTNSGDLIIINSASKQTIWSLFKTYKITVPTNTAVNPNWINIYNTKKLQQIDLSTLTVGSTIDPTNTNFTGTTRPYLLSQNGRFKLKIQNKNIELICCKSGCNNKMKNITYTKYNDRNDTNVFYLYGLSNSLLTDQVLYVDKANKTLTPIIGDILKYSNGFTPYTSSNTNLYFPPNDQTESYATSSLDQSACEKKCLASSDCTQYYSYKKGSVDTCTIGSGAINQYLSTDSTISDASLYIRNKQINSSCEYTTDERKQIKPIDNTNRMNYSTYSFLPGSTQSQANEGGCNTAAFKNLVGMSKPASKEGFEVPGFIQKGTPGDQCTSNSSNINSKCTTQNIQNATKLANYYDNVYKPVYDNVNTGYANLSTDTTAYYTKINDQTNPQDAIDTSGNLTYKYDNNNPSLNVNDVYLSDLNDNIIQQNLLYIIATITSATLLIAAIIISRK
jgi:hypothetical protein